jgi:tripartite-type tricarboxylate transporter receptor subunit TctC
MTKRTAVCAARGAVLAALLCWVPDSPAQQPYPEPYPAKSIRLIVPWPPGGVGDFLGRLLARKLTESWSQQVIVDNRPGGGTNIGSAIVAHAAPDGYTLLIASSTNATNMSLYKKMPYDTARDFAPITLVAMVPLIVVAHPSVPANDIRSLIALAKAKPGKLTYASAGSGTPPHIAAELFKATTDTDILHVPYKGAAPAVTDLIGGQVDIMFTNVSVTLPHIKSAKLKALAVAGAKRIAALPDLPTSAEYEFPGYEASGWWGVLAPAGTPKEVVAKLHGEIVRLLKLPDVVNRLVEQGTEPVGSTPDEFAAVIKSDIEKYAKLIQTTGIRAE